MADGHDELGHARTNVSGGGPQSAPTTVERHPEKVGRFALGRLLGRGGMASVYLGAEEGTERPVAVKLMDPALQRQPDFVQRFLNEAQATAKLHHPNVVETLAHGEVEGWSFIATEYVDGGNVAQLLHEMGPLPPALAAELVTQLLAGLGHAHQQGIVHRDLKPENLLLSAGGILKVGDFGIARSADSQKQLTQTGMLIGTVGYMSPEQARGSTVDLRSDLYAVGIILYELLTGKNPYAAENPATSISRILVNDHPPIFSVRPHASFELEGVLDRLLQLDPGHRFSTAQEAHDALLGYVSDRRSTQPTLVAECLKRPREMKAALERQAADGLVAAARALSAGNALEQNHAAVKLKFALDYVPDHPEARGLLKKLEHVRFEPTANPKVLELLEYLKRYPDTPQALQQVAQLYKMEGNVLQAAIFTKLYLRQRPTDAYAWSQLFQLTGERQPKAQASRLGPLTRELVAGVKTGGFAASASSGPLGGTGLVAPPAMSPPLPPLPAPLPSAPPLVATVEVQAKNPWVGRGIRLGAVLAVCGAAYGGYRWISNTIDAAAAEQRASAEALARQQAALEQKLLEERSRAELEARGAEAEREATRLLDEGLRELTAGSHERAVAAFDALLDKYPKREAASRALFLRGKANLALEKKTDAIRDFGLFLEKRPASPEAPEALLRRAEARAKNLAFDDAVADFEAWFQQHPGHPLWAQARLSRAELWAVRDRPEAAREDLSAVLGGAASDEQKQAAQTALAKLPPPPPPPRAP